MAYSDYGGYAYKNGERVEERSDYTIMPDGTGVGTPGAWRGFAAIAAGASHEEVNAIVSRPQHHVVLGDGPILVGLHKQTSTLIYRSAEELDAIDFLAPECADAFSSYEYEGKTTRYLDSDWSLNSGKPIVLNVDGCKIEILYEHTDNYYQYVRLTQPDGAVWTGFAGYGVGAGLEDCDYGFSTEDCEDALHSHFDGRNVAASEATDWN